MIELLVGFQLASLIALGILIVSIPILFIRACWRTPIPGKKKNQPK